jgi:hypothetical protein
LPSPARCSPSCAPRQVWLTCAAWCQRTDHD